jgi:hypothetical protein
MKEKRCRIKDVKGKSSFIFVRAVNTPPSYIVKREACG